MGYKLAILLFILLKRWACSFVFKILQKKYPSRADLKKKTKPKNPKFGYGAKHHTQTLPSSTFPGDTLHHGDNVGYKQVWTEHDTRLHSVQLPVLHFMASEVCHKALEWQAICGE